MSDPLGDAGAREILVRSQPEAAWALEVAAAGGHHMLMVGAHRTGTTLLARHLPTLLPPLSYQEAMEVTTIHSLAGTPQSEFPLVTHPPFVAPHHSSSVPALVGGGVDLARPGALSLAHRGVLFLEDACEFGPHRLESLRTALDNGEIVLHRSAGVTSFPTKFQLVLATCPCPCGKLDQDCGCSPQMKRRYLARILGPLLDRIDLRVRMRPILASENIDAPGADSTALVREHVKDARGRAALRWAEDGISTNAEVPAKLLRSRKFKLPRTVTAPLDRALAMGALTARGADRTLRVAWTLSDLAGLERPGPDEVATALEFRDRRLREPEN